MWAARGVVRPAWAWQSRAGARHGGFKPPWGGPSRGFGPDSVQRVRVCRALGVRFLGKPWAGRGGAGSTWKVPSSGVARRHAMEGCGGTCLKRKVFDDVSKYLLLFFILRVSLQSFLPGVEMFAWGIQEGGWEWLFRVGSLCTEMGAGSPPGPPSGIGPKKGSLWRCLTAEGDV